MNALWREACASSRTHVLSGARPSVHGDSVESTWSHWRPPASVILSTAIRRLLARETRDSSPIPRRHAPARYNPRDMIACHGETDVGRRRPLNEDAIFAGDGLFLVCDGMGGHKAGEVASRVAADTIATFVQRSGEDPEITWPYGFDRQTSLDANRLRTAIKL